MGAGDKRKPFEPVHPYILDVVRGQRFAECAMRSCPHPAVIRKYGVGGEANVSIYKQIAKELHTTEQCVKNTVYRSKLPKPQKAEPPSRLVKPLSETLASIGPALSESNRGRAAAATAHVMECMDIGRTVDNENPDSLFNGLKAYVQLCLERDFPMTISNACLALGVARKTLLAWKQGQAHTDNPEFQKVAESVYTIIQGGIEATMANGVLNPVLGIWWEKAHFDMKEADRVQETRADPLGEAKSAEQIAAQYEDLPLPDD